MKIRTAITLLFGIIVWLPATSIAQSYQLSEIGTIGKIESDSVEYLFGGPKAIVTDSKLRVFITDGSQNTVRVFSQDGIYITSFGRRGRGPGEFLDITGMTLDQNDNLYILDRHSYRVTRIDRNLSEIETYNLPPKSTFTSGESTFPIAIHAIKHNRFGIVVTGIQTSPDFNLVSIVDTSFREVTGSYVNPMQTIMHPETASSVNLTLASSPSYWSTTFGDGLIAVVHRSFSGKIATLNLSSQYDGTSTLGNWIDEPIRILNPDRIQVSDFNSIPGLIIMNGSRGRIAYQSMWGSAGLVGNKTFLLHFYDVVNGKSFDSYADIFSAAGDLITTLSLDEMGIHLYNENNRIRLIPLHLDSDNKIYFADYSNGLRAPVVRIYKLTQEG